MRFRFPMVILAILCATTLALAQPKPQAAAKLKGVRAERDILYVPGGDPAQALDLYLPEKPSDKPLPMIVWIHGGAWIGGSKNQCPALPFVRMGYAVGSIEYRFVQKALFPAQIQDCQAAIRFLRANAKKYNIDPDHIGVWGGSAGGHLSALLGTAGGKKAFPAIGGNEDQSDRVQAVCDFFGPSDFTTVMKQASEDATKNIFKFNTPGDPYSGLIGVPLAPDEPKARAVSPVHYVSRDNAPMLIVHGTVDALVPFAQSVELAEALEKAGVPVVLQKMPGSGHGGPMFNKPALLNLIQAFFDKNLKGADVKVEALPDSEVTPKPPTTK